MIQYNVAVQSDRYLEMSKLNRTRAKFQYLNWFESNLIENPEDRVSRDDGNFIVQPCQSPITPTPVTYS